MIFFIFIFQIFNNSKNILFNERYMTKCALSYFPALNFYDFEHGKNTHGILDLRGK